MSTTPGPQPGQLGHVLRLVILTKPAKQDIGKPSQEEIVNHEVKERHEKLPEVVFGFCGEVASHVVLILLELGFVECFDTILSF